MTDASAPHIAHIAAPDDALAGSLLTINLGALAANYSLLADKSGKADCAAVIKGDAYGTGLEQASKALWQAGCRTFFVAHPREGERARSVLPSATLYVLNGFVSGGSERELAFCRTHALRPVLGSYEELEQWDAFCKQSGELLPAALHFDTGMNRLGFSPKAAYTLAERWKSTAPAFTPSLIMSHLACADEPAHPLNARQLDQFRSIRALFPDIPASFANSAGIFLGPDYHFDLTRPGIALYGGLVIGDHPNPMAVVASLKARILAVRPVPAGWSVSYGAREVTKRDSRLATLCVGYADGYFRAAGSTDQRKGAKVWIKGFEAPIIGRVTMDLVVVDVTDIPEEIVKRGDWVEMFGPNIPVDQVAASAGTIDYELLTSLGLRAHRIYQ